jgi:hypothetical protein
MCVPLVFGRVSWSARAPSVRLKAKSRRLSGKARVCAIRFDAVLIFMLSRCLRMVQPRHKGKRVGRTPVAQTAVSVVCGLTLQHRPDKRIFDTTLEYEMVYPNPTQEPRTAEPAVRATCSPRWVPGGNYDINPLQSVVR